LEKHTTEDGWWLEGAPKREAGLENTLPKVVVGPKAHLKREGRVGKHTT